MNPTEQPWMKQMEKLAIAAQTTDEHAYDATSDSCLICIGFREFVTPEKVLSILAAHAPQPVSPEHVKLTELLCSELAIRSPRVMMLRGGNDITSSGPDAEAIIQTLRGFVQQLPAPPVKKQPVQEMAEFLYLAVFKISAALSFGNLANAQRYADDALTKSNTEYTDIARNALLNSQQGGNSR